ncbi:hypothetical protein DIPPA_28177 [Diplonema papillatum]|nr:hypothetical protein DIPPA_01139 [Diplonema papillatum]KAJ9473448.1 hypothetical protein DIPPA_28174 [Diplonema papillatum]KAJ9473454.1 hypothetical protein DIPPA_28177 [Diplonema papillatum]|eukprot:gene1155-1777_t
MLRTAFALTLVATCQAAGWPTIEKSPLPAFPWETQKYTEGMQAWGDIPTSSLVDIPDWMMNEDHAAWIPSGPIAEDTEITIKCPADAEGDVCDIYVYVYYCPPCALHGGLPGQLLSSGWEARSCAPHFTLVDGGVKHDMAIFRKQIAKSSSVAFKTVSEARFVGVGVSPFGEECALAGTELSCRGSRHCTWSEGACRDDWCPKTGGGAPPTCVECAAYDGTRPPATLAPETASPMTSIPQTDAPASCKEKGSSCSANSECCDDNCKYYKGGYKCKW